MTAHAQSHCQLHSTFTPAVTRCAHYDRVWICEQEGTSRPEFRYSGGIDTNPRTVHFVLYTWEELNWLLQEGVIAYRVQDTWGH